MFHEEFFISQNNFHSHLKKWSNSNSYIYITTFALSPSRTGAICKLFRKWWFLRCDEKWRSLTWKRFSKNIFSNIVERTYFRFGCLLQAKLPSLRDIFDVVYPGKTRNSSHSCVEISSFSPHSMWVEISELCEDFNWKNLFCSPVIFKLSAVFELWLFEQKVFFFAALSYLSHILYKRQIENL